MDPPTVKRIQTGAKEDCGSGVSLPLWPRRGFSRSLCRAQLRVSSAGSSLGPAKTCREGSPWLGQRPVARPLFGRSTIEMRSACQPPRGAVASEQAAWVTASPRDTVKSYSRLSGGNRLVLVKCVRARISIFIGTSGVSDQARETL